MEASDAPINGELLARPARAASSKQNGTNNTVGAGLARVERTKRYVWWGEGPVMGPRTRDGRKMSSNEWHRVGPGSGLVYTVDSDYTLLK